MARSERRSARGIVIKRSRLVNEIRGQIRTLDQPIDRYLNGLDLATFCLYAVQPPRREIGQPIADTSDAAQGSASDGVGQTLFAMDLCLTCPSALRGRRTG